LIISKADFVIMLHSLLDLLRDGFLFPRSHHSVR
jgi:hypothetical protein